MKFNKKLALFAVAASAFVFGSGFTTETIVTFGDSNTAGTNWETNGYDESTKWVNLVAAAEPDMAVINAGVGGNTSSAARLRYQTDVLSKNPKVITIMFGTNDAVILDSTGKPKVSKSQFKDNLNYFITEAHKQQAGVILMTEPPIIERGEGYYYSRHNYKNYYRYGGYLGFNGARAFHDSYNDITREVAAERGVDLVDNYRNIVTEAGGESDLMLKASGLIDGSGTHLTPSGAGVVYRGVGKFIKVYSFTDYPILTSIGR